MQGSLRFPAVDFLGKLQELVVLGVACWHPHEVVLTCTSGEVRVLVRERNAMVLDHGFSWNETVHDVFDGGDGLTAVA